MNDNNDNNYISDQRDSEISSDISDYISVSVYQILLSNTEIGIISFTHSLFISSSLSSLFFKVYSLTLLICLLVWELGVRMRIGG